MVTKCIVFFLVCRAEFVTDECIYSGFVLNGVATWRENASLRCADEVTDPNEQFFHLKLSVNGTGVFVRLNNVDLGSTGSHFSTIARGGLFSSTDPGDIPMLVKNYRLRPGQNSEVFTYHNCDMTRSGKFGGQYVLFGQQGGAFTEHCMALRRKTAFSTSYKIDVQLFHLSGDQYDERYEVGHMGILFNYENDDNFYVLIVRYSYALLFFIALRYFCLYFSYLPSWQCIPFYITHLFSYLNNHTSFIVLSPVLYIDTFFLFVHSSSVHPCSLSFFVTFFSST